MYGCKDVAKKVCYDLQGSRTRRSCEVGLRVYARVAEDCCIALLQGQLVPTFYGTVSSLNPTSCLTIFTLVYSVHNYNTYSIVKEAQLWPINCKRVSLSSIMML